MAVAGGAAAGLRRPPRLTVVGRFADYSTVTVACIHGWIRHSNRCVPRLRVSTLIVRPGNRPSRRKTAGRPEAGSTAAHAGFGSGLPNSTWLISGMHPALKPVVLTSVNRRVWLAARGGCETLQKWPDQWAGRALAHTGQSPASGKWWKNGSKPTASRTAERIAAAVSRGRTAHAPQRSHAASSSWRPAGA